MGRKPVFEDWTFTQIRVPRWFWEYLAEKTKNRAAWIRKAMQEKAVKDGICEKADFTN